MCHVTPSGKSANSKSHTSQSPSLARLLVNVDNSKCCPYFLGIIPFKVPKRASTTSRNRSRQNIMCLWIQREYYCGHKSPPEFQKCQASGLHPSCQSFDSADPPTISRKSHCCGRRCCSRAVWDSIRKCFNACQAVQTSDVAFPAVLSGNWMLVDTVIRWHRLCTPASDEEVLEALDLWATS